MGLAVKVSHLYKSFQSQTKGLKKIQALDDISLEIYEGEILGILGPNGAGKTTLLNILSTLLLPDAGQIEILGIPSVLKNFYKLRSIFNLSSGYPNYPWSLTVEENLRFYGRLYGLTGKGLSQKTQQLIRMFELEEYARRRFEELSSGTKQRLSLAKALINDPKILFLDEPTVGLDPDVAIRMREIIMDIHRKSEMTILLTTHNMKEAEGMCQRVAFIKQGKIIKLATPQELKLRAGKDDLEEVFIELAKERGIPQKEERGQDQDAFPQNHPIVSEYFHFSLEILSFKSLREWFNRCLAFSYRNFLFALRNVFAFAELIFWPVVSLLSIGLLGDFLQLGEKALGFVLTGAIAGGILQVTQLDVAYSLLYEVWSKSMKHTLLTPVGISEHLFGSWMIGIVRGAIIFCILGLSAIFLFGFQFPPLTVTFVFLLGIFMSSLLLGLLVSVLILIYGQKAEITAWMFAYLFMLLGGIYYPIETLPQFFYLLAQWIPITYFLEYFRTSFGFESLLSWGLLKGFGLLFLYLVLGLLTLRFAFHQARIKGIIVRLSE